MKKVIILLAMLFSATIISQPVFAQEKVKMAYVDLSRLFDEYYKTKDFDKVLEEQHKSFEEERNEKIEKIREAQSKLGLLKEDKKAEVEEDIEAMKAELLEYDRQKKADLTKERNEKIREILLEIEGVVSEYAEKEGYSVILNDRVLIYGNKTFEVTEPILKKLNSSSK